MSPPYKSAAPAAGSRSARTVFVSRGRLPLVADAWRSA